MPQISKKVSSGQNVLEEIIIEAAASKKAERIALISLSKVDGAPVGKMVVCEGRTPMQVNAITEAVSDAVALKLRLHPLATAGRSGSIWIASDYGEIIFHVMTAEARNRYALEDLWSDAEITWIQE